MKVYKDFLPKEEFIKLKNLITSDEFPWYYYDDVTYVSKEKKEIPYYFQFVHLFYHEDKINSDYLQCLKPLFDKLNIFCLLKVKANLNTRVPKLLTNDYHIDISIKPKNIKMKTGIYYLTNSNGPTKFKNGKEIKCEENKFVEFDSNLEHTGVFATDSNRRIVLNLNYIKNDS